MNPEKRSVNRYTHRINSLLIFEIQAKSILKLSQYRVLLSHVFKFLFGGIEVTGRLLLGNFLFYLHKGVVQSFSKVLDEILLKLIENTDLQLTFHKQCYLSVTGLLQSPVQHQLLSIRSTRLQPLLSEGLP